MDKQVAVGIIVAACLYMTYRSIPSMAWTLVWAGATILYAGVGVAIHQIN